MPPEVEQELLIDARAAAYGEDLSGADVPFDDSRQRVVEALLLRAEPPSIVLRSQGQRQREETGDDSRIVEQGSMVGDGEEASVGTSIAQHGSQERSIVFVVLDFVSAVSGHEQTYRQGGDADREASRPGQQQRDVGARPRRRGEGRAEPFGGGVRSQAVLGVGVGDGAVVPRGGHGRGEEGAGQVFGVGQARSKAGERHGGRWGDVGGGRRTTLSSTSGSENDVQVVFFSKYDSHVNSSRASRDSSEDVFFGCTDENDGCHRQERIMLEKRRFRSRISHDQSAVPNRNDSSAVPNTNDSSRPGRRRQRFPRRGLRFLALISCIVATIPNPVILSKPVTIAPEANEDNTIPWRTDQISHCPDSKVETIFDATYTLPSISNNNTDASSTSPSHEDNNPKVLRIPPNLLINTKSGLDSEPKFIQQNVMKNLAFFPGWKLISDDDASCLQKMKGIRESYVSSSDVISWFISTPTPGMFKSDLCRLAQLYLHGGVYLDNDLELTSSLMEDLMTGVEILSAVEIPYKTSRIFQAILGSPPGR